jgi:prepilin-type N-terminal cleavage/methylation domain-containing protein
MRQKPIKEGGFSLTELIIALMVFTVIAGSVVLLLVRSERIFRAEQDVAEMDQNARLAIDFLTRDIQQSRENAAELGPTFKPIYSHNGPDGKTDQITIISSEADTHIPAAALPLLPTSLQPFSALDRYVELMPNSAGQLDPKEVITKIRSDEYMIISSVLEGGSVQFDIIKARSARLNRDGSIGLSFDPLEPKGVQPEIPFGSIYELPYAIRPVSIKRYFVDRSEGDHPALAYSINDGPPIHIARDVVAFQVRYLEVKDGELHGQWVKEQTPSSQYRTEAVEVTFSTRTKSAADEQSERLVTLASVIKPRYPSAGLGRLGSGGAGTRPPDIPTGGGPTATGVPPGLGSPGGASGSGSADGSGMGLGGTGYRNETRRVGPSGPRLGRRLNPR